MVALVVVHLGWLVDQLGTPAQTINNKILFLFWNLKYIKNNISNIENNITSFHGGGWGTRIVIYEAFAVFVFIQNAFKRLPLLYHKINR